MSNMLSFLCSTAAFPSRLHIRKHLVKIFASNLTTLNLETTKYTKEKLGKSAAMKYILVTGGVISGVGKGTVKSTNTFPHIRYLCTGHAEEIL